MSTPCTITAYDADTDQFFTTQCHYDGYEDHTGLLLCMYFNEPSSALKLVKEHQAGFRSLRFGGFIHENGGDASSMLTCSKSIRHMLSQWSTWVYRHYVFSYDKWQVVEETARGIGVRNIQISKSRKEEILDSLCLWQLAYDTAKSLDDCVEAC